MAHKTKIGGTNYEISGGKTKIGGTNYTISGGKTLIGGTAYDIHFDRSISITTKFVASSTVSGTPTYSASVNSNGELIVKMTSARTTYENYDTDRNKFYVYIKGILSGDVVSFNVTDKQPPASTECAIWHGSNKIKIWSDYGTAQSFSFTASETNNLIILLSDGDFNENSTTLTCTFYNLVINGQSIDLTNVPIDS